MCGWVREGRRGQDIQVMTLWDGGSGGMVLVGGEKRAVAGEGRGIGAGAVDGEGGGEGTMAVMMPVVGEMWMS